MLLVSTTRPVIYHSLLSVYMAKSLVDTPWSGGILIYIPLALTYFYGRLYIFIGYFTTCL